MPKTVRHPAPSAPQESDRAQRNKTKAYLIGAGIASLASAAYLIRDGGLPGQNICVYDETDVTGGSLDGEGSPEHNYVIRGGRMFTEEAYTCMFDLLSFIPSLTAPDKSVKEEIYEFNALVKSHSHARLLKSGQKVDASAIGLSNKDRLDLIAIMASRSRPSVLSGSKTFSNRHSSRRTSGTCGAPRSRFSHGTARSS